MDDVRVLVLSAAGIYGFLAIMMGVVPGTVLSKTPPGPGVVPPNVGHELHVDTGLDELLERRPDVVIPVEE